MPDTTKPTRTLIDLENLGTFSEELKAKYARSATVAALTTRVNTLAGTVDTLTGEGDGSIAKIVDAAINKFATDVTDDDVINSYKELIDWAAAHGSEAAELVASIAENKAAISNLKKLIGELPEDATATTVIDYIIEALAGYVKTSDIQTASADEIRALLADDDE